MHKNCASPGEVYLWQCLRHPSVLPLQKRICCKNVDIFLIPYCPVSQYKALKSPKFRHSPERFKMMLGFNKDLMGGFEYEYGVCHLDLKVDTILNKSELRAIICNFRGIAETIKLANK